MPPPAVVKAAANPAQIVHPIPGQFGMTVKAELMLDFPRGEGRKENGAGSSDLNPGPPQVGSESITQLPRWHQFLNELKGL